MSKLETVCSLLVNLILSASQSENLYAFELGIIRDNLINLTLESLTDINNNQLKQDWFNLIQYRECYIKNKLLCICGIGKQSPESYLLTACPACKGTKEYIKKSKDFPDHVHIISFIEDALNTIRFKLNIPYPIYNIRRQIIYNWILEFPGENN